MKKQLMLLLPLLAVAGGAYAQNNDTLSVSQTDSILLSPTAKALEEVKITADRPLYAVDGEKHIYNTSDDPSVQTGTASDALQNAPGVEVDAEGNITLRGSQSVEVWINDRPSNLSGESLRQYIKTLPANSIARIEVITNPSARYGGSGPVVNIVTSKKILRNEFISIGATGNHRPQVSPWLSYVYSNKKFSINLYAEYDYSHTWSDQSGRSTLITPQGDTSTIKEYTAHSDNWRHGSYFYLSGNYDFDTMRSLSFWGGAYPSWYRSESSADIQWQELIYNPGDYSYRSTSTASIPQVGYYGGLHYSHRLDDKGQMLWIRTAADGFNYTSDGTEQRQYLSLPALDYTVRHLGINRGGVGLSAEVGYSLPFAEHWELEAGVTGDYQIPSIRTYTRDTLPGNRRDTLQSYNKYYRHEGYGSYFTLKRNFGNFAAKVGLRLEQSIGSATYTGYTTEVSRENYLIPSPSVHLSYRTPSMHNFTLSYTLRTSTPSATDLTRFIVFSNESYEIGNPDLLPSHTHNLEGGWNKFFEGFGSVGVDLYYKANTDGQGTLVGRSTSAAAIRRVPTSISPTAPRPCSICASRPAPCTWATTASSARANGWTTTSGRATCGSTYGASCGTCCKCSATSTIPLVKSPSSAATAPSSPPTSASVPTCSTVTCRSISASRISSTPTHALLPTPTPTSPAIQPPATARATSPSASPCASARWNSRARPAPATLPTNNN